MLLHGQLLCQASLGQHMAATDPSNSPALLPITSTVTVQPAILCVSSLRYVSFLTHCCVFSLISTSKNRPMSFITVCDVQLRRAQTNCCLSILPSSPTGNTRSFAEACICYHVLNASALLLVVCRLVCGAETGSSAYPFVAALLSKLTSVDIACVKISQNSEIHDARSSTLSIAKARG